MSYILDALRRAEAERERGSVPGLHAQTQAVASSRLDEQGHRRRPGALGWPAAAVLALLLALLGAAIFSWWSRGDDRRPATPAVIKAAPAAAAPSSPPTPQQRAPVAPPLPAPRRAAPTPAPVIAPSPARPAAPATLIERPVPTVGELPEAIRRALPPLQTGGAMYSETPAKRLLILNGQVFHEGDKVATDLVLEQIRLKGAVLSFRGQRYSISY